MAALRSRRATRLPDLAAILLLIAVPLVLFWRALSGAMVVAGYDLILYSYPYRVATARAFEQGHFPFWNPDLFGGVPFLANIQAAVLYPFNFLFIWPGGPQLLSWSIIVHLMVAGLFFYAFARKAIALGAAASALAAVSFSASGFAIAQSEHLNQVNALPWVPALVLAFDRAYTTRRLWWSAIIAIVLALQIFAGHPQDVYFGLLLTIVWAIVLLVRQHGLPIRARVRQLLSPLVGILAGVLVAAVQLLPTLELTRYSIRGGGLPYSEAIAFSLPGRGLLGNLLPDYTSPLYTEWAGYIGLVATVLALFAIVRCWRNPSVAVLAVAAGIALLFALGPLTPVFWLAYHLVPGVSAFRVPARALLVSTFAGSALAGVGLVELERALHARQFRLALLPAIFAAALLLIEGLAFALQHMNSRLPLLKVFPSPIPARLLLTWLVIILVIAVAGFVARRFPTVLSISVLALASIEMILAAQPLNPLHVLPASIYEGSRAIDSALAADTGHYRSLSLAGLTDQQLNGGLSDPRFRAYTARRSIDQPDFAMQAGRATIDGYDGGILPLASYIRFRSLLLPEGTTNVPDYPLIVLTDQVVRPDLLALLGVSNVLEQSSSTNATLPVETEVGTVSILQNPTARKHAFMLHDIRPSHGAEADLGLLRSSSFDPTVSAIANPACSVGSASASDGVRISRNDAEALDVSVTSSSPGLLVVSTVAYPGWRATIDGRQAPMVLVDDLLQGVCLPAGTHQVTLRFTPTAWPAAVALSVLGLLLTIFLAVANRSLKRFVGSAVV